MVSETVVINSRDTKLDEITVTGQSSKPSKPIMPAVTMPMSKPALMAW